jgi:hypothetical protein
MKKFLWLLFTMVALVVATAPAAAQSQTTVYATAQRFENGLMIWRSDNGFIWVLGNNGQAYTFPASMYSNLPDNPIFGTPPSRLRPIFGFGKVWGNYQSVRNLLGWPTLKELGFDMPIRATSDAVYLTQLDQTVIQVNNNGTWQRLNGQPPVGPAIDYFNADRGTVAPGSVVTLSWQMSRVDGAILATYDQNNTLLSEEALPAIASHAVVAPAGVTSLRFVLWGFVYIRPNGFEAIANRVVSAEKTILVQADGATTTTTQAVFQSYQRGFMIWEANGGSVMVFYGNNGGTMGAYPQASYENLPDNPIPDVPAGCIRSINGFGRIWGNFDDIRGSIGCAVAPEQSYTMTMTTYSNRTSIYYTLPDGRTISAQSNRFWGFTDQP